CEKTYKDPATLQQHEKTHWLTWPFSCNICGKIFTQRGTMTRHMRSHLGLKSFACNECGMRFTYQYRLQSTCVYTQSFNQQCAKASQEEKSRPGQPCACGAGDYSTSLSHLAPQLPEGAAEE
ncbi:hypothetical protein A6R68_21776, partial [Neotoma lepida]